MMGVRLTEEEYEELTGQRAFEPWTPGAPARKTSKYRNVRIEIDGITFDSKHEAEVWTQLETLRRHGAYRAVIRQVSFPLAKGSYRYRCDFLVIDKDGKMIVVDAKSEITRRNRVYINKKKQMYADYGIEIVEM